MHVIQLGIQSTSSQRGTIWHDDAGDEQRGMEGEEKLADPQSSLVTPWTRCSFYKYSMVQSDLPALLSLSFFSFFLSLQNKILLVDFSQNFAEWVWRISQLNLNILARMF